MIGFYDYTVILTYCSVISAVAGISLALTGGNPYIAVFLLMFSGLCDAFDGPVARRKKNRTDQMKAFGIQIDSLADLAAFGILPVCIGLALRTKLYGELGGFHIPGVLVTAISCLYILAAIIRLAYYNVTEEERQSTETGVRKYYVGLPVTSASLIFPTVVLVERFIPGNGIWLYYVVMTMVAAGFVGNFRLRKPGFKAILVMVAIGALEAAVFLLVRMLTHG